MCEDGSVGRVSGFGLWCMRVVGRGLGPESGGVRFVLCMCAL